MQKVLTFPQMEAQQDAGSAPAIVDRSGHTFNGSVLFADIVEYAKRPVSDQLRVKDRFNACLSDALAGIAPADRIVLDTGDGAAVSFLGDPEDALFVAMNVAGLLERTEDEPAFQARIGINLGPVRLMRDTNGLPSIIGDGINVAQRVMSFARPGQVLVSRPYQEAVTRLSPEHVALFSYLGSRTDKHVREHEVYVVSAPVAQVQELAARRKRQRSSHAKPTAEQAKSGSRISRGLAWGFFSMAAAGLAVAAYFSLTSGAAPAPAALPASPPRAMIAPSRPVEPQPPAPDPSTVTAEPPIAAQPQPPAVPISAAAEPPKPEPTPPARMAPPRAKTKPGGSSEPTPQAVAAMPAQVEHKPEPELIQPGPKPDTVPESQPEQAASKPATLPTQYRATAGPTALVVLAISPWGEVLVDGKMVGVSPPMAELELSPGKHTIEVRNGPFKPYQTDVDLGPNETTRIKHKFLQGR